MKSPCKWIFALLLLAGCAHQAPKSNPNPSLSPRAFWMDQDQRAIEAAKILGKITLRYHSKKQNLSGQGRLVALLPDRMRLEVRDPLGKVQYLVTLMAPNLVAYYPSQKLAYADERSGNSYLRKFTGINFSFQDLQSVWLGLLPESIRKNPFTEWEWDPIRGLFKASLTTKEYKVTCFVDSRLAALRELLVESSAEPIRVTYNDFEPCCSGIGKHGATHIPVAQTVNVTLEKTKTAIEVQWEEIKPMNEPKSAELFQPSLPEGVQTILLR